MLSLPPPALHFNSMNFWLTFQLSSFLSQLRFTLFKHHFNHCKSTLISESISNSSSNYFFTTDNHYSSVLSHWEIAKNVSCLTCPQPPSWEGGSKKGSSQFDQNIPILLDTAVSKCSLNLLFTSDLSLKSTVSLKNYYLVTCFVAQILLSTWKHFGGIAPSLKKQSLVLNPWVLSSHYYWLS